MSAVGEEQTSGDVRVTSALPPMTDNLLMEWHVRFVPTTDIRQASFIGRIERGFDFFGYHFSPAGLAVAKNTVANLHRESISAL